MIGVGVSYGAISVINAIPCGIGATIGVDLCTRVLFEPGDGPVRVDSVGRKGVGDGLVRECVKRTLEAIGQDPSITYKVRVESEIPPSRGLKSSSSVSNATICAVLDYYDVQMDEMDIIRLGVECAIACHVTITGAFDDACGCHLGGLVVTENSERRLILRKEMPKYDVIICSPKEKITKDKVDRGTYRKRRRQFEEFARSVEGYPLSVLTKNGAAVSEITGIDNSIAKEAIAKGALAAGVSGTGPAVAIVCEPGKGDEMEERLGEHAGYDIIRCRVR